MFGFQKIQKKCNGILALNLRLTNISLFKNRAYLDFMYEGNITEELKRLADFTGKKIKIIVDDE